MAAHPDSVVSSAAAATMRSWVLISGSPRRRARKERSEAVSRLRGVAAGPPRKPTPTPGDLLLSIAGRTLPTIPRGPRAHKPGRDGRHTASGSTGTKSNLSPTPRSRPQPGARPLSSRYLPARAVDEGEQVRRARHTARDQAVDTGAEAGVRRGAVAVLVPVAAQLDQLGEVGDRAGECERVLGEASGSAASTDCGRCRAPVVAAGPTAPWPCRSAGPARPREPPAPRRARSLGARRRARRRRCAGPERVVVHRAVVVADQPVRVTSSGSNSTWVRASSATGARCEVSSST